MAWGRCLDGAPCNQVDSVLGVWLFNIATGAKHLCALARKPGYRTRGAVTRVEGDWAGFCERFGYPTWASGLRPCL